MKTMNELLKNKIYIAETGEVMQREDGNAPSGKRLNGQWVLRNAGGSFVDHSAYRLMLMERNGFMITPERN
jgi:hypothetical protein